MVAGGAGSVFGLGVRRDDQSDGPYSSSSTKKQVRPLISRCKEEEKAAAGDRHRGGQRPLFRIEDLADDNFVVPAASSPTYLISVVHLKSLNPNRQSEKKGSSRFESENKDPDLMPRIFEIRRVFWTETEKKMEVYLKGGSNNNWFFFSFPGFQERGAGRVIPWREIKNCEVHRVREEVCVRIQVVDDSKFEVEVQGSI